MKDFGNNRKGQFIVLIAIIMAAFMFSLVFTISQLSLNRQELSYEPVDEVVLAVSSDFERCVANALAKATENINDKKIGDEVIKRWIKSVTEVYGSLGLEIFSIEPEVTIKWEENFGISSIYAAYDVNISAYGLEGLKIRTGKHVSIKILSAFVTLEKNFMIEFQVSQTGKIILGLDEPVPNLTRDFVTIKINGTETIEVSEINYLGNGKYVIAFSVNPKIVVDNVTLTVKTPNDGIIVSAYKRLCMLTLQSLDLMSGIWNDGEMLVNGTKYNLPHELQVFPGQKLNMVFIPPAEVNFQGWGGGPFKIISEDWENMNALFNLTDAGETSIIALYGSQETASIILQSHEIRFLEDKNKGSITLNDSEYSLPRTVEDIPHGNYIVKYTPFFGYYFKYWKFSGGVRPPDGDCLKNPISVAVHGDGTITAVYSKPYDWSTLYLDRNKIRREELVLVTFPDWSRDWGFNTPPISHGQKRILIVNSNPTPNLVLTNNLINITLYMEAVPPKSAKLINITFGYSRPDGIFVKIGSNSTIKPADLDPYIIIQFKTKENNRYVPEGSVFTLIVEVTFEKEPYGTFKVYFGEAGNKVTISKIDLFS